MKTSKIIMLVSAFCALSTVSLAQTTKVADAELKTNVTPITSALSAVNQLNPVTYQYTAPIQGVKMPTGTQYGFLSGNVQSVLPGVVKTQSYLYPAGKNTQRSVDVQTVDMQSLVPVLLGAIKEQQAQIDALKAEVQSLRKTGNTTTAL
ncbi:tail fiber domain-containing protein [Mucilaginibacter galii]|nr:tail fiber domain-containing protein [Mucilaginibacter galii]